MKTFRPNVTILVGAGLSLASGLPDGSALAEKALALVLNGNRVLLEDAELLQARRFARRLRLEILLERLATELPRDFLFSVFDLLKGGTPNFNHLAVIALKPYSILTTNQDLLLEGAVKALRVRHSIIHLHGRCDDKRSIVTTISQYLSGLRPALADQFRKTLAGKHLIVLGYSGRDRDVLPLLNEGTMKSVTWLKQPGSEISPELRQLKERLGGRVKILVQDANLWLRNRLTAKERSYLEGIEERLAADLKGRSKVSVRRPKSLSLLEVNLALGRMVEHVGLYDIAFQLYTRLLRHARRSGQSLERQTYIQLAVGRTQTFQYRFINACRRFIRIAGNNKVTKAQRCEALAGCVFAFRNSSRYQAAQTALAELEVLLSKAPTTSAFDKCRGEAAAARAGMLRLTGEALTSIEMYLKAERFFRRARDVDGWIEVSTWLGDNLLTLGRFREADIYLRRSIDDANAYGRHFSSEWAEFLRAELLGMSGDVATALLIIEDAYQVFRKIRNPQGQVYSLLYISDFSRAMSLLDAERALRHADKILQKHNFAYAYGRFLLERAELARAQRCSSEVEYYLTSLGRHLGQRRRFNTSPDLLIAHGQSVAAEHAREINRPGASDLLQQAWRMYSKLRADHCVTRIEVALWLLGHSHRDRTELIATCTREGYGHELNRLRRRSHDYYALHFV